MKFHNPEESTRLRSPHGFSIAAEAMNTRLPQMLRFAVVGFAVDAATDVRAA
jgi:hypothetical protein